MMYTPSEIREKAIKCGLKVDKRDADQFISELSSYMEKLQQENNNLKKDVKDLTESISYYKSIEKTLQKALVLAEKTAQDIKAVALKDAEAIEEEARNKASRIQLEATNKLMLLEHKTLNLIHQYDSFRIQFVNLLNSQLELLNNQSFQINCEDFLYREDRHEEKTDNNSNLKTDIEAGYMSLDKEAAYQPADDNASKPGDMEASYQIDSEIAHKNVNDRTSHKHDKPEKAEEEPGAKHEDTKPNVLLPESREGRQEQTLDDGFEIIHVLDEDN